MTEMAWLLVMLCAVLQSTGNLLLRIGIDRAGGFELSLSGLLGLAGQPLFDLGFILYGLSALIWFRAISIAPLNIAYPLLVSISFIIVSAGAALLLQENLTPLKIVGIVVIMIGIGLVSQG